jgi:hypothetical protein
MTKATAKTTSKKRGRPRKPVWEISLSDAQLVWEPRLRRMKLPKEIKAPQEVQEGAIPARVRDPWGRKTRPTKEHLGESLDHESVTQSGDPFPTLQQETATDESIVVSAEWRHYLGYMSVIAEIQSPGDKGAELKSLFLQDARFQHRKRAPKIPAELGTPAEFKARVLGHELDIILDHRKRAVRIRIYPLPPDENEELNQSDDPKGQWAGLTWMPDPDPNDQC